MFNVNIFAYKKILHAICLYTCCSSSPQVLQELAKRCPNLTHLLLDFSQANQLHDFSELSAFPTKLRFLCLCLSDVIFLDNFMKRIYSFINGLEMLHIQGTYEKVPSVPDSVTYHNRILFIKIHVLFRLKKKKVKFMRLSTSGLSSRRPRT